LERERLELLETLKGELIEPSKIYEGRCLDLALQVPEQLTAHNALEAHTRGELGMNEIIQAQSLKASLASRSGIFGWRDHTSRISFVSTYKMDNLHPIQIRTFMINYIRCNGCKGWRLKNKNCSA